MGLCPKPGHTKTIITRATLSVALYARQKQFTWDQIHYLEVRPYQNVK